jgi:C4-dicarboxylate-specific signal transduction histidine kinase
LLRDPLDGVADPCRTEFDALAAELIVPLGCQGALIGFLVCGRPRSGAYFSVGDVSFLHTFANHAALSLQNARTFRDLALLNTDLERRVEERTEQLGRSTTQLSTSLAELGAAYRTLQTSQEQLVAAQKMAAFGRLAAGIAHEMNTPLGAALNGLRIAQELAAECEALVDAGAPPEERRGAFAELAALITNVDEWTRKAVAYIRSLKAHGRGGDGLPAPFELGRLLEHDLQPLLMHRLRLVGGALELRLASDLPELYGDRGRLGQVLANLLSNAIDACEGLPSERTHIIIEAMREEGEVVVHIHDRGIGVPEEARERIFEAFYTTKPPGKGTGLGLSIARDIVTGEFGGTLTCTACEPGGTTFTLRLPFMAASAGQTAAA